MPEESKEQLSSPSRKQTANSPNQSANQSTQGNQSTSQSINQSTNQSIAGQSNHLTEPLVIRPPFRLTLKPREISALIDELLSNYLSIKLSYDPTEAAVWTKELSIAIKNLLKNIANTQSDQSINQSNNQSVNQSRYKFCVQVLIGEQKGGGIRCGARCLWDSNTDKVIQTNYQNQSIYCCVAAFGVYLY